MTAHRLRLSKLLLLSGHGGRGHICRWLAPVAFPDSDIRPDSDFKECTFAWPQKVREYSLCDHPSHQVVWRGPLSLRILIASALGLVSKHRVLAVDQVARQPTVVQSIPRSDFPRIGAWLLRIE
jgi:hypothetical protein